MKGLDQFIEWHTGSSWLKNITVCSLVIVHVLNLFRPNSLAEPKLYSHKWISRLSHLFCFRCMNTFAVNSAPCMKMTASSTSLSAAGMAVTGRRLTAFFLSLFLCHMLWYICYKQCSKVFVLNHKQWQHLTKKSAQTLNFTFSFSISAIMTGSYNNFFRMFDRNTRRDITLEASRESSKPRATLKPRKVSTGGKRKKDEISVDSLDFNKKILHTAWHPKDNVIAVAATNNLYIFQDKIN